VSSVAKKILVATTNPGKIAELTAMLDADVKWLSLADFDDIAEVKENGTTFVENACKKAFGYAKATGLWTLADDSGLMIDVLEGAPGVKSARFAGEKIEDADMELIDQRNVDKVLKLLNGVPKEERTAKFVCCLCLANPGQVLIETEGMLEGFITKEPAGESGFGYDPIFFVPHLNKTVAQLTAKEKNAISHRGKAIRKLKPLLRQLLKTS
jgi:XTP/dITP diphosphohydrolase